MSIPKRSKSSIPRRNILRGIGAAIALPWMESISAAGPVSGAAKTLAGPPLRTAFMFMPNGVVPSHWTPKGDGDDWQATPMLKSLHQHRADLVLLENLWHEETVGRNGHWPKVPAWLAGGFVQRGHGGDLDTGGTSVDQLIARAVGHNTILPSLELGLDPIRSGIDNVGGGFPRVLGSFISWRDPHTPVPKETTPRLAFDRLFRTDNTLPSLTGVAADDKRLRQALQRDNQSILDLVLDDAKDMRRKVSKADQAKLDEYLDSVRSVEKRIQTAIEPPARWVNDDQFTMARPAPGKPKSHQEHLSLMMDIMLLAFWTDTTRICTFMMGDAQSGQVFDFLDGVGKSSFHGISHHREDRKKRDEYEKIGTWHVEQFATLINKMKKLDEGGSSLLDNSQILFGSSLKDGNRHDPHDLPLVLAGGAQGKIKTGRRLRAKKDTPMCNLLLQMMHNAGADHKRLGDSTGSLSLS